MSLNFVISGPDVSTARVWPRTRARVITATEAGAAPCPVPQAAGARAVATRVLVITAPRVTRWQARARVPRAGEERDVTRDAPGRDTVRGARRSASAKTVSAECFLCCLDFRLQLNKLTLRLKVFELTIKSHKTNKTTAECQTFELVVMYELNFTTNDDGWADEFDVVWGKYFNSYPPRERNVNVSCNSGHSHYLTISG